MKFRYFILRFENAVESLEIIEFDINIPSGIGAQQFERFRGAHAFASNTLDYLSDAIDLGPGL